MDLNDLSTIPTCTRIAGFNLLTHTLLLLLSQLLYYRNWSILVKILRPIARRDRSVMTCSTGKPQSWDLRTLRIQEASSFWTFTSLPTTLLRYVDHRRTRTVVQQYLCTFLCDCDCLGNLHLPVTFMFSSCFLFQCTRSQQL
jgi:hypothetical protein